MYTYIYKYIYKHIFTYLFFLRVEYCNCCAPDDLPAYLHTQEVYICKSVFLLFACVCKYSFVCKCSFVCIFEYAHVCKSACVSVCVCQCSWSCVQDYIHVCEGCVRVLMCALRVQLRQETARTLWHITSYQMFHFPNWCFIFLINVSFSQSSSCMVWPCYFLKSPWKCEYASPTMPIATAHDPLIKTWFFNVINHTNGASLLSWWGPISNYKYNPCYRHIIDLHTWRASMGWLRLVGSLKL